MNSLSAQEDRHHVASQDDARTSRFFTVFLWALFLFCLALANWHGTWVAALAVGLPMVLVSTFLLITAPGALLTRMVVGASLMGYAGLNIHQAHGMVEMHFEIFVLLALLLVYEDWRVIVCAAGVIAAHHLGMNYLQEAGYKVYCMPMPSLGMVLVHASFVVVEAAALCYLSVLMHKKTLQAALNQVSIQENLESIQVIASQTQVGVETIRVATEELTRSAGSIAEGAQAQAASLEETSASLEEITATMRNTSANSVQATQLASSAKESAEQGQSVVSDAVTAMQEINVASARISDIISTINEIAFQTNLLAVNAAVEAARAGEEGRGFAVVAAEVRSLAQRSAGAAKEIKGLIQDTLKKVERGTELVNRSGETLRAIVKSAKLVTDIIGEISIASAEQSTGLEQVNVAVIQIDQVTQRNATQTDELSATAKSLSEQAIRLAQLVDKFRTDDTDQHDHRVIQGLTHPRAAMVEEIESGYPRALMPAS